MGGYGSTRWDWHQKKTVIENCLAISTTYLRKEGLLNLDCETKGAFYWRDRNSSVGFSLLWRKEKPLLQLRYTASEESVDVVYPMIATYPYFGGVRWWFICPLSVNGVDCRRRVGKLYIPPRQKYFGCRSCYDLSYKTRQEYDKRFAHINLDKIESMNQQMDSLSPSRQAQWAIFMLKSMDYDRRRWDRYGKRLSEPDETEIFR